MICQVIYFNKVFTDYNPLLSIEPCYDLSNNTLIYLQSIIFITDEFY